MRHAPALYHSAHKRGSDADRRLLLRAGALRSARPRFQSHELPLFHLPAHERRPVRRLVQRGTLAFALRRRAGPVQVERKATRSFCPECGTQLAFELDGARDEIDVTTCSLDDPNRLVPTDHTRVSSKLEWVKLADGLPQFRESREEG
jgi:hypothetical protein